MIPRDVLNVTGNGSDYHRALDNAIVQLEQVVEPNLVYINNEQPGSYAWRPTSIEGNLLQYKAGAKIITLGVELSIQFSFTLGET